MLDTGFPVTIDTAQGPVTIEERPERIVSISPTSTEVLYAVGAGDQVVAFDSLSKYPESAPVTDLSAFTPSLEAIVAQDPDLVFLSYDPADIVAGLSAVGIPAIVHGTPAGLGDAFTQWEQVGAATGHVADAALLLAQVQGDLDAAFGSVPDSAAELTYYYELEPTLYSATATTFIGELLAGTTMTNIADGQDPDGYGYPQLSAEYVVDADPDLILLADTMCCGQSAATVAERPGWATLTAVSAGSILELDDDVASRWGPRIVELVEDVVAAMRTFDAANA
jgi:iron complex transport system substrate-binding protein